MKLNWLDKALIGLSPKAACERLQYKEMISRAYYDSADIGRQKDGWTTTNAPGNVVDRMDRDIVRARARDLERNDDMYKSIILDLERNVVGTGIIMQSQVVDGDDKDDDATCNAIEKAWKVWCKPKNCTVTGMVSFSELQKLIVRRRFVDGGLLVLKVYRSGKFFLQLLEVDCLDSTVIRLGQNRVVGGIEIDEFNKPVAYHIKFMDVTGIYPTQTQRLTAEQVIYLPAVTRISQVREFSPSASSLSKVDSVKELLEAALTKEQVQACFGVAITTQGGGMGGIGRGVLPSSGKGAGGNAPYREEYLVPGMMTHLQPGEGIDSISPSGMSSSADGIIRTIQRQAGSGAGLSYEAVSRDMSQVNYSSARQGMLQDRKTYSEWQQFLVDHFLAPVFDEWLFWAVTAGKLRLPDYYKQPEKYTTVKWLPAGWDWIDPLKEANANRIALETGQTTLQKICAGRGEDYHDVMRQREKERQEFSKLLPEPKLAAKPTKSPQEEAETIEKQEPSEVAPKKDTAEPTDSTTLNGAQITSLVSIVSLVSAAQLSFESALAILTSCLGIQDAEARKILSNGKKIEPMEQEPKKEGVIDAQGTEQPQQPEQL